MHRESRPVVTMENLPILPSPPSGCSDQPLLHNEPEQPPHFDLQWTPNSPECTNCRERDDDHEMLWQSREQYAWGFKDACEQLEDCNKRKEAYRIKREQERIRFEQSESKRHKYILIFNTQRVYRFQHEFISILMKTLSQKIPTGPKSSC